MRDDPPPPPITITDPSRPFAPSELLEPPGQWPRPSRRVTAAAVIALAAASTVVVVHRWNTHEQRLAAERRLASLHLTAVIEGTNGSFDPDGAHGAWGAQVRIRSGPAEEFRVLAVTLDEDAWKVDPASLPEAASTSHLIDVAFTGSCSQFERLATPTRLRVSSRRPGGPVINRTVGFDASSMLEFPRRSCGLADLGSNLESEIGGAHRRGSVAIMDVQLRNPSRHAGRLTALSIASTQVTTWPRLPAVLPPSTAGHPGSLVRLQLTVRYVFCRPAGQDTNLNLDLLDDAGNPYHVVVGPDEPTAQVLDQLAGDSCRR